MKNAEAVELVMDIYMTMQSIYLAPRPTRPVTKGELLDMVKQEDRIAAACVAMRCLEWLEIHAPTTENTPCKQVK